MAGRGELSALCGVLLDEAQWLGVDELCRAAGVDREALIGMVDTGLVWPRGRVLEEWRFPASSVFRVRTAWRLRRDLEVNLSGAALALDLLEELHELRRRVETLEAMLAAYHTTPRR